ncbi:hypothetical protein SKAU_G00298810 [Synaphobranchus kaupii]|uniref:Uncharacterized protein n=1 Tax=Synaphobranchus kaupii TaxID=118154 RepID=A0A9Q1IN24_SYNKA|nr:hypothetical protein SKAU_G00298810 [Synaphobranchus kaupii]
MSRVDLRDVRFRLKKGPPPCGYQVTPPQPLAAAMANGVHRPGAHTPPECMPALFPRPANQRLLGNVGHERGFPGAASCRETVCAGLTSRSLSVISQTTRLGPHGGIGLRVPLSHAARSGSRPSACTTEPALDPCVFYTCS